MVYGILATAMFMAVHAPHLPPNFREESLRKWRETYKRKRDQMPLGLLTKSKDLKAEGLWPWQALLHDRLRSPAETCSRPPASTQVLPMMGTVLP